MIQFIIVALLLLHIYTSPTVQCDQEEMRDEMQVYGSVLCRAELEGVSADIILNVSHAPDSPSIPLDQLTTHPCVLSADSMPLPGELFNLL